MTFRWNTYSIALTGLVFFVLLLNFSGLVHFEMMMRSGDSMSHCPFAPGEALCTMGIFGHINAWRGTFSSLPQWEFSNLFALLAFASSVSVWLVRKPEHSPPKLIFAASLSRPYNENTSPSTFLEEAFSSGILHPKLF